MYKSYISSQLTCFLLDSGSGELNFGVDVTTNLRLEPKSLFVFFFSSSIWPPALSISQQRWLGSSEWHALLRGGNGTYYTKTCLSLLADTMDEKRKEKSGLRTTCSFSSSFSPCGLFMYLRLFTLQKVLMSLFGWNCYMHATFERYKYPFSNS